MFASLNDPTTYLNRKLYGFFLDKKLPKVENLNDFANTFITFHNSNFSVCGDISFPSSINIWKLYFKCDFDTFNTDASQILTENGNSIKNSNILVEYAKNWCYPIERIDLRNERYIIFLQRSIAFNQILKQVFELDTNIVPKRYGQMVKNDAKKLYLENVLNDENSLASYRVELIRLVLQRILKYSEWCLLSITSDINDNDEAGRALTLHLATSGSQNCRNIINNKQSNDIIIQCGIVIDPDTKKTVNISTEEYHRMRSKDMRLMAMHKYGIRDMGLIGCLEERLGIAAVTVDLLEVKHTSPVQIKRSAKGSTKGASFILYNSARIETLLRQFDQRVQCGECKPLPEISNIDYTLLKHEEEWQLLYGSIFDFPNLLVRCQSRLELGQISIHLIVRFLDNLSSVFSAYYRRVRILTEPRDHLMPTQYARIYLIKAVQKILNQALSLLGIEPISSM